MKKNLFLLTLALCLVLVVKVYSQGEIVSHSKSIINASLTDSGANCAGGEIHDDGTFEGGIGWASVTSDGRFVIKFIPEAYSWKYNKFCIALGRAPSVDGNMMFDIVVYDTTGSGGTPGNLVYELDSQQVSGIPIIPVYQFYSFSNLNIPVLNNGAYYIGIKFNPSNNNYLKYSAMDVDCPLWPGYYYSNFQPYWSPIQNGFPGPYRCLGYRMEGFRPVGITGNNGSVPEEYSLSQNYPNPFNPVTVISYSIPRSGHIVLKVCDVLGRDIGTLVSEFKQAGNYSIEFNAEKLPSGVYFYKLIAGDYVETRKMVLIK